MGRTPKGTQNPEAVQRLNQLKAVWGLKTDKELADRLKKPASYIAKWRANGMTGITEVLIDEILDCESKEGTGQLWLMSA